MPENPTGNFGWLLLSGESKSRTAKRFDTKDNEVEANRPALVDEYKLVKRLRDNSGKPAPKAAQIPNYSATTR